MAIQIFKVDGRYCISENQRWVEGLYETEEAAIIAINLDANKLRKLWIRAGQNALSKEDLLTIK